MTPPISSKGSPVLHPTVNYESGMLARAPRLSGNPREFNKPTSMMGAMYCTECGTQNTKGSRFCSMCGRQITSAPGGVAEEEAPQHPFDPQLAAYELLRGLISERPPFGEWRPELTKIPAELQRDVDVAVHAYQLSVFLDMARAAYGLATSEKARMHLLLLSKCDAKLESQLPVLFEAFKAGAAIHNPGSSSRLVNDPQNRFHVTLAVSVMYVSDWPEEQKKYVLMPLAECLGRGRLWAETVFAPQVKIPVEATDTIKWSESPGPFERQLQRQQNNLLFPKMVRLVTAQQVTEARLADLRRELDFMGRYKPFVLRGLSLSGKETVEEAREFVTEAVELQELCSVLGGYFEPETRVLQSASEAMEREIVEVTKDASLQDLFREYRAWSDIGGLLQRISVALPPGCDMNDYTIRSVLSEEIDTIRNYAATFRISEALADDSLQRAQAILADAMREGMSADVAQPKLQAFRSGLEPPKPEPRPGIWAGLKRFVQRG